MTTNNQSENLAYLAEIASNYKRNLLYTRTLGFAFIGIGLANLIVGSNFQSPENTAVTSGCLFLTGLSMLAYSNTQLKAEGNVEYEKYLVSSNNSPRKQALAKEQIPRIENEIDAVKLTTSVYAFMGLASIAMSIIGNSFPEIRHAIHNASDNFNPNVEFISSLLAIWSIANLMNLFPLGFVIKDDKNRNHRKEILKEYQNQKTNDH